MSVRFVVGKPDDGKVKLLDMAFPARSAAQKPTIGHRRVRQPKHGTEGRVKRDGLLFGNADGV